MESTSTPNASPIRILLMGDQPVIRTSLRMLIESEPGLTVVGEVPNSVDALAAALAAAHDQPDLIVIDLHHDSLDLFPRFITAAQGKRVLILTGMRDLAAPQRAVSQGAMGLVLKEKPAEELIRAIRKVYAGEVWLDRTMMANVLHQISVSRGGVTQTGSAESQIATLTERQRKIIALIGEGLKNKQIAERLFISETTVRHHLTSIFDKLGVSDRCQLVIYAYRHNLAKIPR